MIALLTRPRQAQRRLTPADLVATFKHVRLLPKVVTDLPAPDYDPRHCDGPAFVHEHRGASRPQDIRTGRRWIAC